MVHVGVDLDKRSSQIAIVSNEGQIVQHWLPNDAVRLREFVLAAAVTHLRLQLLGCISGPTNPRPSEVPRVSGWLQKTGLRLRSVGFSRDRVAIGAEE